MSSSEKERYCGLTASQTLSTLLHGFCIESAVTLFSPKPEFGFILSSGLIGVAGYTAFFRNSSLLIEKTCAFGSGMIIGGVCTQVCLQYFQ